MTELPPDVAERLREVYRATGDYFRRGAMFIGAVCAISVLGGALRQIWWLAGFSVVFFGALIALGLKLARRYDDPMTSPVMRAIFDAPDQIASIVKTSAQSSTGMFRTEWLHIRLHDKKHLGLKLDPAEIDHIRGVLADRSPAAEVKPPMPVPSARVVRGARDTV